jgi:GT2 family glycosyltransferase
VPTAEVVRAPRNLGFGGACNVAIRRLLGVGCDHVALINNDALPEPGWLEPLAETLAADARTGAATPKVLLSERYVTVELRCKAVRGGAEDPRPLGVQLCGARVNGNDVSGRIELVSGFWGWEEDATTVRGAFAWSDGCGVARLPVPADADADVDRALVAVQLACGHGPREVNIVTSLDGGVRTMPVDVQPEWHDAGSIGPTFEVVNNAGTVLLTNGATADRGYLEPDDGRYSSPAEVFGWSGAAVLLSRAYLEDVGPFDEDFFLYSEDADLSWRGRLRGWRYRYEPRSVVRHEHSATVGSRSSLVRHLAERNRVVLLLRCAPAPIAWKALSEMGRRLFDAAWRDLVVRPVRLRPPVTTHIRQALRVAGGTARLAPSALRARRQIRGLGQSPPWR